MLCASHLQSLLGLARTETRALSSWRQCRPSLASAPRQAGPWTRPSLLSGVVHGPLTPLARDRHREGKTESGEKAEHKGRRGKEALRGRVWSHRGPAFIRIAGGRAGFDPVIRWERERLYCTFFNITVDQNNALCTRGRVCAGGQRSAWDTPCFQSQTQKPPGSLWVSLASSLFSSPRPDLDQRDSLLSNKSQHL